MIKLIEAFEKGEKGEHETDDDTSDHWAGAIKKEAEKHGYKVKDTGWKRSPGASHRTRAVTVNHGTYGFAQGVAYKHRHGGVTYQQHDVSIPKDERGSGHGGKMVGALAAGFKKVGVKKVPIHVNSNREFWNHQNKKHGVWNTED